MTSPRRAKEHRALCRLLWLAPVIGALAACHLIYPFDLERPPQDAAPPDLRQDSGPGVDLPPRVDLPRADTALPPLTLSCVPPVGLTSVDSLIEPAISADGQRLVAQQRGSPYGLLCLKRKDPQKHDLSASWTPCMTESKGNFDLNFYTRAGVTYLLTSRWQSGIRRIFRYEAAGGGCEMLTPLLPPLTATDDLDGPDIRENRRSDGVEEIYASYQIPAPPLPPTTSEIVVLHGPAVIGPLQRTTLTELGSPAMEDDPAILPDGSLKG